MRANRWSPRPVQAALIRAAAFLVPILASIAFVTVASRFVAPPTTSFWLYLGWWVALTGAATVVLLVADRLARRLLPLAALYKLSLVFPDNAPSRFSTALKRRSVGTLEERVASAKAGASHTTPIEAAQQLLSLVAELDAHDPLTRGHSDRVRAYAQMIAEELRLSYRDIDLLNWAALLHDIGKLDVPTEILSKHGRPSDEEWGIIRRHPEAGGEIVAPLRAWLGEWIEAVTQHHERWDGKGYPNGVAGEKIALAGRIVAVADTFDVITSARSYKSAADAAAGRHEISQFAGTQFDPRVVRAFLGISLGRLRFAMGPLSWLSHAPLLGRLPLTPAIGTVSGTFAAVVTALSSGLVAPPPPEQILAATQAAVARNVAASVEEDASVVVRPPGSVGDQRLVSVRIVRGVSRGTAIVTPGGSIRYTPPPNFNGPVSLLYELCDLQGRCTRATLRIVVKPLNDDPVARDDVLRQAEDEPVSVNALANDTDPDGDPLVVSSVSDVSVGSAVLSRGRVNLRLPDDFNGKVTFAYVVSDGSGGHASAGATVFVTPKNDAPRAVPDAARTPVGTPLRITVLENDSDPDGDTLWVLRASQPSRGRSENHGAAVTYTPPRGFRGVAHFTYTVSDREYATATARVDVAVGPANLAPRAIDDTARVVAGESALVDVLANDSDPDGDRVHLVRLGPPEAGSAHGEGDRIRYTAPRSYQGAVTFSYTAADPQGAYSRAMVRVIVSKPSSPPSQPSAPPPPTPRPPAPAPSVLAAEPPPATRPATPRRPAPRAPAPAPEPPRILNTAPSFTAGPDQALLEDAGATTVRGWATGISPGPPVDAGQTVSFTTGTSNNLLFAAGGQPAVASDGTLTFTTAPNASGSALVSVRAVDDGDSAYGGSDTSATETFTIVVTAVNDAPFFTAGPDPVVVEDSGPQSLPGWATAIGSGPSDESGQSVSFAVTNSNNLLFAAGGQPAVASDGTLTFTTAPNASGSALVSVRAVDDGGSANGGSDTSATQTFTIQASGAPDAPVAVADGVSVNEDDAAGVTFDVLANDSDPDGDPLTVASFDGSTIASGALTPNGGGSFTYVPDPAFSGSESFTYTVADGTGGTASATVTITVVPQPDAPAASDDAYTTPQDTALVVAAPGVLANDYDEDGDPLTLATTPATAPTSGTLALGADGSFTYTPNAGFVGTDGFTYRIDDGTGRTADGVVTITVDSTVVSNTLYLQSTGPSADLWDISTTPPPAASPVPDHDADGNPGLTINSSDGKESISDPLEYQVWRYVLPAPVVFNGPATLQLWSTTSLFQLNKDVHPHVYLYDCDAGGASCVKIAESDVHVNNWNLLPTWVYHEVAIGSVSRTIAAGRELHVRLLVGHRDVWVAMTAAYPSALAITTG
jgi:putative nucleotidyltransferase with HDIG domain